MFTTTATGVTTSADEITTQLLADLDAARGRLRVARFARDSKDTPAHRRQVENALATVDHLLDLYLVLHPVETTAEWMARCETTYGPGILTRLDEQPS